MTGNGETWLRLCPHCCWHQKLCVLADAGCCTVVTSCQSGPKNCERRLLLNLHYSCSSMRLRACQYRVGSQILGLARQWDDEAATPQTAPLAFLILIECPCLDEPEHQECAATPTFSPSHACWTVTASCPCSLQSCACAPEALPQPCWPLHSHLITMQASLLLGRRADVAQMHSGRSKQRKSLSLGHWTRNVSCILAAHPHAACTGSWTSAAHWMRAQLT